MTDRFDRYTTQLTALIKEAIACSPASWEDGRLTIDCDGSYMNYALKNGTCEEKAQISGNLRQLSEDLYVVMRQSGDWWVKAVIYFFRKDDSWSFNVDFTYPNKSSSNQGNTSNNLSTTSTKPWWKMWN